MGLLLGLTTALAYGIADFLARFSTRKVGVGGSLLGALLAGSGVLTLWLLVTGHPWAPLLPALPWLVLSGVLSYAMLGLLYAALQRGPISIASPVVAVHPALVVLLLFAAGSRPSLREWIGLFVTTAGGLALASQIDPVGAAQGLPRGYARITGALAGACALTLSFQILCVQHSATLVGPVAAAWGSRTFAFLAALLASPLARGVRLGTASAWGITALQGLLDVAAVLALAAGSDGAARTIVPVVGSAFSAVTVVLARFILNETMTSRQWGAIGIVLAGVVVLGSG
ncbi:MAG TPA: EamA family transporter [Polyangiaceae bacterium]|nr:EamA family transporter [Polyangiaceae bacterium]